MRAISYVLRVVGIVITATNLFSLSARAATPQVLTASTQDMLAYVNYVNAQINDRTRFTVATCEARLQQIKTELENVGPDSFDRERIRATYQQIMQATFAGRMALGQRLSDFVLLPSSNEQTLRLCVDSMRSIHRFLRYIEDYVFLWVEKPPQFVDGTSSNFGPVLQGQVPDLLTRSGFEEVKLRSGDVLLSRGNAYTSAAISRIGKEEAQFSHLTQVYIDAPIGTEMTIEQAIHSERAFTVEAHIEVGSFTRRFREYVADGNMRVVLFRPKIDPARAHTAAKSIYDRVIAYQKGNRSVFSLDLQPVANDGASQAPSTTPNPSSETGVRLFGVFDRGANPNDNPPYDFKMNLENAKEIFCAEIVSLAYKAASLTVPSFRTEIRHNDLTKRMGITTQLTFAPADIEVDPNFELLAEWRDRRKLAGVMRKDVVLTAMYQWMEEHKYTFRTGLVDFVKTQIAWFGRQTELGFQRRLPRNMSQDIISMTFILDRVGARLEDHLVRFSRTYEQQNGGILPNFFEQMAALDRYRRADFEAYKRRKRDDEAVAPDFHFDFRADGT